MSDDKFVKRPKNSGEAGELGSGIEQAESQEMPSDDDTDTMADVQDAEDETGDAESEDVSDRYRDNGDVNDDDDSDLDNVRLPGDNLPDDDGQVDEVDQAEEETRYVVGVRMRPATKAEYFRARHLDVKPGTKVVVEAERGLAIGKVVTSKLPVDSVNNGGLPIRNIVRIADERDALIEKENLQRNKEALRICREAIEQVGLPMRLIDVEYQHSANKATFYFAAEGRVDFRELVRQLAQELRIRVEMRQIGIRDEAKLLGGLGPCGLPTCCATFLDDFSPVSIRQAKEQNLTLNPEKVSGLCGRLMCCLGYEASTYRGEQEGLPKIGKKADTWKGRGRVLEINIFSRIMRLELENREYLTISIDDYRAFKEDPEGFTKLMEEKEEQDRKRAIDKLNSGGDSSGMRSRRRNGPPPRTKAPAQVRSLSDASEPEVEPRPEREMETVRPQVDEVRTLSEDESGSGENAQKRRSRGGRRRRRKPGEGGPDQSSPQPREQADSRSSGPEGNTSDSGARRERPQPRQTDEAGGDPTRSRPRRRGGRRRSGRRGPDGSPSSGEGGGSPSSGGSSGSEN